MNATSPQWRNHAALTQALAARGLAAAAAEAAQSWAKDFPEDAIALRAAAELCETARNPAAGEYYFRAHAAGPEHVATALRTAWWWTARHDRLAALGPVLEALERALVEASGEGTANLRFLASLAALRAGRPDIAASVCRGEVGVAPHGRLLEWLRTSVGRAGEFVPRGTGLVLVACVWGRKFANTFAAASLASLVDRSNLPVLAAGRRTVLLVICDEDARQAIAQSPAARLLAHYAELRFVDIPPQVHAGNPGTNVLGPAQHVGFHAAAAQGADAFFLHTDAIYPKGALGHVRRLADAGCDIFCTSGFSATMEDMLEFVEHERAADGSLAIEPRRLVSAAFARMHPRSIAMLMRADSRTRPSHSSLLLFQERDYLRMRYFQAGPVWIARRLWSPGLTFNYDTSDNGLLHRLVAAAPSPPKIVYGADSDDFMIVDLAPAEQGTERTGIVEAGDDLAAAIHADARSRGFLDRLRVDAFAFDCRIVPAEPPPWPPAPDCGALLARIEQLCRAELS